MLRAIYGFDHCLKFTSPAVNATFADWWSANSWDGAALSANAARAAIDQDGWLGGYGSNIDQIITFNMTGYVPANPTKVTIGFRIKTLSAYAGQHSLVHLGSTTSPTDITTYLFMAGSAGAPWLGTAAAGYYAELTYDFVAGTVSAQIDGVAIANYTAAALSTAIKAAWAAGNGCVNFRLGNTLNARYAIKDVYILDAVAGDGMTTFIGPQRMYPVIPDSAAGAGWAVSAGSNTLLDTLLAAPPATTTVNSPADKTPLNMSLKTTAPAGTKITAVSLGLNGLSQGDNPSVSKVELSLGGTTLAAKFVPLQRAVQNFAPIGIYPKAPDGTTWTIANLDSTAIKLTPDTAV